MADHESGRIQYQKITPGRRFRAPEPFGANTRSVRTDTKEVTTMKEITLTAENFRQEVLESDVPVVVDFWATWCGPCMMMGPVIADLAESYAGKIKVGKVNVDEEDTLAEKYRINAIPAVFLFKNGSVAATSIGYKDKEALIKALGI